MVSLRYFFSMTAEYWKGSLFGLLFFLALIGILVFEKEKIKRYALLWYTLLVLVFIYNPVTLFISRKVLEPSTFDQYYLRFFSLLPVMVVIAYVCTILLSRLAGGKKLVAVLAVCFVLAASGKCIYAHDWYTKADNRNKVPQDVVTICDIFANEDADTIRIMAPQKVAVYLRQMDSRFSMPYGRFLPDEGLELTALKPDCASVAKYAAKKDVDYVVVWANESTLNAFLDYGFTEYGRTANYAVLRPYTPSWIMTEYDMTSGDQGIFYTVEDAKGKSLIVIDGGDAENEQQVRDVINEKGGVVDAWIITHYHQDHVDSFNAIYEKPEGITIKEVYASPLDANLFHGIAQKWDDVDSFDKFMEITKDATNINYVKRGDVVKFDDLTITFYNTFDDKVMDFNQDIPNNSSLVFKLATKNRSALICGDCHSDLITEYLADTYKDELKANILQCGHHGNNSMPVETGIYELVNPEVAVFDTPTKIMTSPNYTAGALAAYFQERGIRIIWYETAPNIFGL